MTTAGRRAYHQVINIVGYKHWPPFLDAERNRTNAAWEADTPDLNALRDGLAALVAKFNKATDPDDKTVELQDSVVAIGELRDARRAREMARPMPPEQRHKAAHDALIMHQRRVRLGRDNVWTIR